MKLISQVAIVGTLFIGLEANSAETARRSSQLSSSMIHQNLTPNLYRTSMAHITTCDDVGAQSLVLPSALSLLKSVTDNVDMMVYGDLQKGEFETTAGLEARREQFWQATIGDPEKIFIRIVPPRGSLQYDADTATMKVYNLFQDFSIFDPLHKVTKLLIAKDMRDRDGYTGTNAYGATVKVASLTSTSYYVSFPDESIVDGSGNSRSPTWLFKMNIDEARRFKDNAVIVVFGSLRRPYYKADSHLAKATFDDPSEVYFHESIFNLNLQCALLMSGSRVVADLTARH